MMIVKAGTYSQNTDRVDGELINVGEAHVCGFLDVYGSEEARLASGLQGKEKIGVSQRRESG